MVFEDLKAKAPFRHINDTYSIFICDKIKVHNLNHKLNLQHVIL